MFSKIKLSKDNQSNNLPIILFVVYTIFWQSMIWGISFYVIITLKESPWWLVFSVFLAGQQFKPYHFGIMSKQEYYTKYKSNGEIDQSTDD